MCAACVPNIRPRERTWICEPVVQPEPPRTDAPGLQSPPFGCLSKQRFGRIDLAPGTVDRTASLLLCNEPPAPAGEYRHL